MASRGDTGCHNPDEFGDIWLYILVGDCPPTRGCARPTGCMLPRFAPDPIHDSPPEPTRVSRGLAWGTEGSVGEHRRTAHQTVEHLERVDGSPERSNLLESLAPAYGLEQEPRPNPPVGCAKSSLKPPLSRSGVSILASRRFGVRQSQSTSMRIQRC